MRMILIKKITRYKNREKPTMLSKLACFTYTALLLWTLSGCSTVPHRSQAARAPLSIANQATLFGGTAGYIVSKTTSISAPAGVLTGVVLGRAIGLSLERRMTLQQRLAHFGIKVYEIEDEIMLWLPTEKFFIPGSVQLNPSYFPALDNVALFLQSVPHVSVKVSGYSSYLEDKVESIAFSKQQAQNIADYIWEKGTDSRVLYVKGYGAADPIADNRIMAGKKINARIIITLRRLTV